jgi:hypothetical protein
MVGEWLLIVEEVEELRESFAAMAVLVFFADGKLGEGFAEWREKENRIVAESCIAARYWQDFAIHAIGHNGERAAAAGERNGTSKMPTAFRTPSCLHSERSARRALRPKPERQVRNRLRKRGHREIWNNAAPCRSHFPQTSVQLPRSRAENQTRAAAPLRLRGKVGVARGREIRRVFRRWRKRGTA